MPLAILSAVSACGGNGGTPDATVFPGPPDAHPRDADPVDAAPDQNDSFAQAIQLTYNMPFAAGIEHAGDVDYYRFDGGAGDWLQIDAQMDDPNNSAAVFLYDASMTQIAEDDFGSLTTHLAAAGVYYLKVEEQNMAFGGVGMGGPGFTYHVSVNQLADPTPMYAFDHETGDDAASAQYVTGQTTQLLGTLRDASDKDVFAFPTHDAARIELLTMAVGPTGDGSTSDVGTLTVTDATGMTIIGRVSNATPAATLDVPVGASGATGTYLLWIDHAATPPGANDFYVALSLNGPDDPHENETAAAPGTNDTRATALASGELVPFQTGPFTLAGWVSFLPPGDVDYMGFIAPTATGMPFVTCEAQLAGSGLTGLHYELRDDTDVVLAQADEATSFGFNPTFTAGMRYWIKTSATGQDPIVTGDYVRCFVAFF
jgi:hypothetical protein